MACKARAVKKGAFGDKPATASGFRKGSVSRVAGAYFQAAVLTGP
jgi:hypothetical protein